VNQRFDFWNVIDVARTNQAEFERILGEMSEQDLVDFYWEHAQAQSELFKAGLGDHMEAPVTDDAMSLMAEWVVDSGIDYYDSVLEDMSVAPKRVPRDARRDVRGQVGGYYEERFGVPIRYADEPPPQQSSTEPKVH
jgi:hypothetical protein